MVPDQLKTRARRVVEEIINQGDLAASRTGPRSAARGSLLPAGGSQDPRAALPGSHRLHARIRGTPHGRGFRRAAAVTGVARPRG